MAARQQNVPIIMYGEPVVTDIPAMVERGIRTGHLNLANLGINALPDEFFKIVPFGEVVVTDPKAKKNDFLGFGDFEDECENNELDVGTKGLEGETTDNQEEEEDEKDEDNYGKIKVLRCKYFDIANVTLKPKEDILNVSRLTLASNQFVCIPNVVCLMTSLRILDVQDNKMAVLPKEIGRLQNLFRLVVSHNFLVDICPEVYHLRNLRALLAQDNKLVQIDDEIQNLKLIEFLDLSHNLLLEMPRTIGCVKRLDTLNLSYNQIIFLPDEIGRLQALRVLDLNNNQLPELPCTIGELRGLEHLSARRNRLTVFPQLRYNGALKELHLGGNMLTEVNGDVLRSLVGLRVLELRDNLLTSFPEEASYMDSLVRLDLCNNELDNLPNSLGNLVNLKALSLDGNPFECISIKQAILHHGTEDVLQHLRNRMEPAFNQADEQGFTPSTAAATTSPPCNLFGLSEREKHVMSVTRFLDYSNRQMDDLPEVVVSDALQYRVHTVKLSRNLFTTIPVRIKDFLHQLVELDISYNKMSDLPSFIGYAPHLQVLDVQDNQLTSLPPEIVNLRKLQKLNISHNKFYELPDVLYEMKGLEMLFAANNHITDLNAAGLCLLPKLKVLDLVNNDIKHLPPQLGLLPELRRLQVAGNPFRQPRATVVSRGTLFLLDWLRDRLPQDSRN